MSTAAFLVTDEIFGQWLTQWFNHEPVEIPAKLEIPFGTREWCDESYNTHEGCPNGCFYCYNHTFAWTKRNVWKRPIWSYYGKEIHLKPRWYKGWQDRDKRYVIMYPSTHDTFPETMERSFSIMRSMLNARNIQVLFVTKPRLDVIEPFIERFKHYKDRMIVRMTITTNSSAELEFWEPKAPSFTERCECLENLYHAGYNTSISVEPMLPPLNAENYDLVYAETKFIDLFIPFVTDTIWIGTMNHIPTKRNFRGQLLTEHQYNKFQDLRAFYTDRIIEHLTLMLHELPLIRWKESIKKRMIRIMRRGKHIF